MMRTASRTILGATTAAATVLLMAPPASAYQDLIGGFGIESSTVDGDGIAYIGLTVDCADEVQSVDFWGSVREPVGKTRSVTGYGYGSAACENGAASVTLKVLPDAGEFGPRRVMISAGAYACVGDYDYYYYCDSVDLQETRKLTRK